MPDRYPSFVPDLTATLETPIKIAGGVATTIKIVLVWRGTDIALCVKFLDASGNEIGMRDVAWA